MLLHTSWQNEQKLVRLSRSPSLFFYLFFRVWSCSATKAGRTRMLRFTITHQALAYSDHSPLLGLILTHLNIPLHRPRLHSKSAKFYSAAIPRKPLGLKTTRAQNHRYSAGPSSLGLCLHGYPAATHTHEKFVHTNSLKVKLR